MSWKVKAKAKESGSKFQKDPEEERQFDELRRKYAYAVAFLLINNIKQSELRTYLESPVNSKRYESLKRFRVDILEKRPRAKQWVDKPFYLGLKVAETEGNDEGLFRTQLVVNDYIFKQQTTVVASNEELSQYTDTIAKIIESEKIWSDPAMADFDFGEREDTQTPVKKRVTAVKPKKVPAAEEERKSD